VDRREIAAEKQKCKAKLGYVPSDADAKWAILNRDLLEHAQHHNWGLYRNAKLSMGAVLEHEGRIANALSIYLEVCYLDVNGPENIGGAVDAGFADDYPPFQPDHGMLAPAVVDKVFELAEVLQLDEADLERRFMELAQEVHKALRLPVSAEQGWTMLSNEA
jgi:hypothetical protein